jgi:splicing factor, arginine/serine-rich 3
MDRKIYVGGISEGLEKPDMEDGFSKFGEIENIWMARKPAGFAFVVCRRSANSSLLARPYQLH